MAAAPKLSKVVQTVGWQFKKVSYWLAGEVWLEYVEVGGTVRVLPSALKLSKNVQAEGGWFKTGCY